MIAIRAITARVPQRLLALCLLVAIVAACYRIVQFARFEYAYYSAGRALEREAFDEAGQYLATCLQLQPESGRALFRAAQAARRSDQPELMEEQLALCAELSWPPAAIELQQLMLAFQRGEGDETTEHILRKCLDPKNPDRYEVLEALSQGYIRTYRLAAALQCLDDWVADQPDSPGARMRRGWVYDRLDRFPDAEADYRALLASRPKDSAARLRLAQILRQQGKTPEAAVVFEELQQAGTTLRGVDLGLAQTYRDLGRGDDAWRLLEELEARQPGDSAVMLEMGKLCFAAGRDKEARRWFEQAATSAPSEYEPQYQLFLCLSRLGETAEAERAEQAFKAIEADLATVGKLAEKLHSRPNDAEIRYQIADVFSRRGEEIEAARWLEVVVRLDPQHAAARRTLAEYYERIGKADRARIHRRALALLAGNRY